MTATTDTTAKASGLVHLAGPGDSPLVVPNRSSFRNISEDESAFDITLSAQPGDLVELGASLTTAGGSGTFARLWFSVLVIRGAGERDVAPAPRDGIPNWAMRGSDSDLTVPPYAFEVQDGDVVRGTLTLRLVAAASAGDRKLAGRWWAKVLPT